jgi:uncharacterized OsmC-like protein
VSEPGIREALENLGAKLSADPSKARVKNAAATARLAGGLRCEVSGPKDERMATDMPPAMGGQGAAPNPGWYLRAGMAACTATTIAMRAAKLGIALDTLEVTVESESDSRGLLGIEAGVSAALGDIRTRVKIGGKAEPRALRELVEWGDAHSPVGCTVSKAIACSLEIETI